MTLAVYLRPYEDELLSSWVMRTCHANATSFYSLLWHHGLNSYAQADIDQCKNEPFLIWLADTLGNPRGVGGVKAQSLLPLLGIEQQFPHRSWIRGIDRRASKWRSFQFCPQCLVEDESPYFRINWRLEWHEVCPIHRVAMPNLCSECRTPIILHRVSWKKTHLAYCYKCGVDLREMQTDDVCLSRQIIEAISGLNAIVSKRDEATYAAVHFLEAFIEQWRRVQGIEEPVKALDKFGVHIDMSFAEPFPATFLAVAAYRLWQLDRSLLEQFIADNRRWFNLAVRDFMCPEVMRPFYRPIKWAYELNEEIIEKAAKEVRDSGREPTAARIAQKIGCHVSRIEKLLEPNSMGSTMSI